MELIACLSFYREDPKIFALLPGCLEALGSVLSRHDAAQSAPIKLEDFHQMQRVCVQLFARYLSIRKAFYSFVQLFLN